MKGKPKPEMYREYVVQTYYAPYGFEDVCTAEDKADAFRLVAEYRANEPQRIHRVHSRLVPVEEVA